MGEKQYDSLQEQQGPYGAMTIPSVTYEGSGWTTTLKQPACPFPEHHPKCDERFKFPGSDNMRFICTELRGHRGHHFATSDNPSRFWRMEWQ